MKLPVERIKKIAVFRALQLGDMLCAVPAIRALRQACPEARITLLGLPWAQSLISRFHLYFDDFIHFPGYPGLPEQPFAAAEFPGFLLNMQAQQFDLVLQMQGNGSLVNPVMELFGSRYVAGFRTTGHYAPDNGLFADYPDGIHETERHLQLMAHLGIPAGSTDLEFPLTDRDKADFDRLSLPVSPGEYVVVHPGSRGAWRQWPVAYFAQLADYAAGRGYKVVLTGTADELAIVAAVACHMQQPSIIAAGKTSLGAVGVLIKDAAVLISNCTGVSHISAAFKTPSIVISMDGEPERWAPLNRAIHRTIDWTRTPEYSLVYAQLEELLSRPAERKELRDAGQVAG